MSKQRSQRLNQTLNVGLERELRLARELEALTMLHKLAMLFVDEAGLKPILSEVVDVAIAISGADFGNIQLLNTNSSDLKIAAQRGFPQWWLDFWETTSVGQGTCGTALERGERVIVEDVEQSPVFLGTPALDIQRRVGVRAVQSTPLVSRSGKPVGIFSTHFRKPHRPTERVLQLLDLLARQGADIIEQAQDKAALRESEERYRSLVLATSFVWIADINGEFSRPQPSWESYTGQNRDQHQGNGWVDAVHPDDRARVADVWQRAALTRSLYEVEWRAWHAASRQWRHCLTRGVPVRGSDGEVREWIGAVTDIHDRKMLEARLQQKDKLASLGVLAGGVAHDFNNLLGGVLAQAELALAEHHAGMSPVPGLA
jgi:PAS domain S-box-containing protein